MRKWGLAFLLFALLCRFPLTATAREGCVLETATVAAQAGQTVTLTVTLKGSPGVTNGAICLEYDTRLLELTDLRPGEALGSLARCRKDYPAGEETVGYLVFAAARPLTGDVPLLSATFRVAEDAGGTAQVTARGEYLRSNGQSTAAFAEVAFGVSSGAVRVETLGQRMKGDVNGDGRINVTDAAMVYDSLNGKRVLDALEQSAGDVDENGIVDKTDAILIYRWVNNRITAFSKAPEGEQS